MSNPRPGRGGLARAAVMGSGVSILARGLRALVGVATISVLSRFMTPGQFGAFALVLFVVTFAQVFADFGLRVALVQKKEVEPIELDSVFWVSIALGLILMAGVWLASDRIAMLFDEPGIGVHIRTISPIFLLMGMQGVALSQLERAFRFQWVALAELVSAIAGAVVAIVLAMQGAAMMALVVQQLVIAGLATAMILAFARWRPRFAFSFTALKPLFGYGAFVTLSGAIQFLSTNADRPIVGTRLSAPDLGFLAMSQQIITAPIRTISTNVRRVSFPIMASIQNENERVALGHRVTLHGLFLVMAPICLGIWALAAPITDLLLGPGWEKVGALLGIMSFTALVGTVAELNSAIFSSKGKARFLFGWSCFSLLVNVAALLFSAQFGLMAVAWGRLGVMLFLVPLNCWFMMRLLGQPFRTIPAALWRAGVAAISMALLVYGADRLMHLEGVAPLIRLIAGTALGVVLYAGFIWLIDRQAVMMLVNKVRKR